MNLRLLVLPALGLLSLLTTGCATTAGSSPVTRLDQRGCVAQYQVTTAAGLRVDADEPVSQRIDASAPCYVGRDGAPSVYAPYTLPRYQQPYSVTIQSQTQGEALFAPEVKLLDSDGRVTRVVGFDRFSTRGDILQATVFINADNKDERYLIVGSASDAVGKTSKRLVSGTIVVPLLVGIPFFGVHGTESAESRTLSYNGVVTAQAASSAPSGRDRTRRASSRDASRADFCCGF
ncbi:MAG TPA: MalM family protein [Nevskiaceae bacterium]|nr:MalM family protein [Nevskiaceae bacterium]